MSPGFIGYLLVYTETERAGNKKFREEAWHFLLSETAALHSLGGNGSSTQSCVWERDKFMEVGYFSLSLTKQ